VRNSYRSALRSDRADRANIGLLGDIGAGGTILGGLFLEPFAAGTPLAHVDIAGTAYHVKPGSGAPGPTGSSAAALVEFLEAEAGR
jgi:leucyl aminopeptidase